MAIEYSLLIGSVLILASIAITKLVDNLGIPSLLLFLVIGMLAGSEGPGGIYFDDAQLAQEIGIIQLITAPATSPFSLLPGFLAQMGIGASIGLIVGRGTVFVMNRLKLPYEGLYPVFALAAAAMTPIWSPAKGPCFARGTRRLSLSARRTSPECGRSSAVNCPTVTAPGSQVPISTSAESRNHHVKSRRNSCSLPARR